MMNLDVKIDPNVKAIEKFEQLFGERVDEYTKWLLLNEERTVGMITEPLSVNEVKKLMKLGEMTGWNKITIRKTSLKYNKYVKVGENYYSKNFMYNVSLVLGPNLEIAIFGKETPLFLWNENGICLIAPTLTESVNPEKVIDLSKIARIENVSNKPNNCSIIDPVDQFISKLKSEEKKNLINKLISELEIRI
jgi:hypothetical protein